MTNEEIFEEIKTGWGWASAPINIQLLANKGLLSIYWPIIKDSLNDPGIQDFRVKEGISLALSSQCDNNYCFISHSFILYGLGFTMKEIKTIVSELRFPSMVEDKDRWDIVLKWAFFFGRPPGLSDSSSKTSPLLVPHLLNESEYRALFKICSIVDLLNRFSEFYFHNIQVDKETIFSEPGSQFKLLIPDLTKFHRKVRSPDGEFDQPVVVICMFCKAIKDSLGHWHALETVLVKLERNSIFSHGACPNCATSFIEQQN